MEYLGEANGNMIRPSSLEHKIFPDRHFFHTSWCYGRRILNEFQSDCRAMVEFGSSILCRCSTFFFVNC